MVRHMFNNVIAHNQIEITRRQLVEQPSSNVALKTFVSFPCATSAAALSGSMPHISTPFLNSFSENPPSAASDFEDTRKIARNETKDIGPSRPVIFG